MEVGRPYVLVVQHEPGEGLGVLGESLEVRGVNARIVHVHAGEAVPSSLDGAAGLVILGGAMGVNDADKFPHLTSELRLIEHALARDFPVLGICLGSELLAAALGARVFATGRHEIGWHEVRLRDAAREDAIFRGTRDTFTALHWHGDAFDLPRGAAPLASSMMTEHQAFRHGERAWGLLFHLEATLPIVESMATEDVHALTEGALTTSALLAQTGDELTRITPIAKRVLERWAKLVAT
jgi:GMP synthase (glutamine-hydrolysing)